jgi:hypothetical protein
MTPKTMPQGGKQRVEDAIVPYFGQSEFGFSLRECKPIMSREEDVSSEASNKENDA